MKKIYLALVLTSFSFLQAQNWCATDEVQQQLEIKDPSIKLRRERAEAQLLAENAQSYLKRNGINFNSNNKKSQTIYEIPVVVHVIVPTGSAIGTDYNKTDQQIADWLENTNKIYATTYGNGYYTEGANNDGGTVIPIRLVLAKRNPQCGPTSGIIRYDGGSLSGYNANGVNSNGNTNGSGVTTSQVRQLAPHWPENTYFNIYVINKIDGGGQYGIMGWAGYPSNPDYAYESFMKSFVVTLPNNNTLAHEFGHAMSLIHTFGSANSSGNECPANNDCTVDNDKVCDTPPAQSLLSVFPTPSNSDKNPCTNDFYEGVQYNIMNYTNAPRKFTPGQRDRALAQFMMLRGSLLTSNGGIAPTSEVVPAPINYTCKPTKVNNTGNYNVGPTLVKVGAINNKTSGQNDNLFYVDYTTMNCLNNGLYTDLDFNQTQNIQVNIIGNAQDIRVWIDYNNNGSFEASELVASANSVPTPNGFNSDATWTGSFKAPSTTVLNTPLRMRVVADINASSTNACADMNYGQTEDYTVTFKDSTLNVQDIKNDKKYSLYPNPANNGIFNLKLNDNADSNKDVSVKISDTAGRVVFSLSSTISAERVVKVNSGLPAGIYFVTIETNGNKQVEKLIVTK